MKSFSQELMPEKEIRKGGWEIISAREVAEEVIRSRVGHVMMG